MRLSALFLFVPVSVCIGCAAKDFSKELGEASAAVGAAEQQVRKELEPQLPAFADARRAEAAAKLYVWSPSDGCQQLARKEIGARPAGCFIDKDLKSQPLEVRQPDAAVRKLGVISAYFDGLGALASAGSKNEIEKAFAEATKGLAGLAQALDGGGSTRVGKSLTDFGTKAGATVSFVVKQRRVSLMRKLVREADPLIQDLVEDVVAHLEGAGVDPAYDRLAGALTDADTRAANALDAGDQVALKAAYDDLEVAQAKFVKHAEGSIYTRVLAIAGTHSGLKAVLERNPTPDEVIAYVQSLQSLVSILEEKRK